MASYSRILPSGSANGRPIVIAAIVSPGTLVHTAVTGTTSSDEAYLWASNTGTTPAKITLQWGGTTTGDNIATEVVIPPNEVPIPIAFGTSLNNGVEVRAYSDVASAIVITGNVNRITA